MAIKMGLDNFHVTNGQKDTAVSLQMIEQWRKENVLYLTKASFIGHIRD